jgi:hypothetical protein
MSYKPGEPDGGTILEGSTVITAAQHQAARQTVAANATNLSDARLLLDMLGILTPHEEEAFR